MFHNRCRDFEAYLKARISDLEQAAIDTKERNEQREYDLMSKIEQLTAALAMNPGAAARIQATTPAPARPALTRDSQARMPRRVATPTSMGWSPHRRPPEEERPAATPEEPAAPAASSST